MTNFELDDRHRSLRDFLTMALGSPPWLVRTEFGALRDDERPMALVEPTTPTGPGELPARVTVPQGNVQRMQTFTITLYPEVGRTAREARLASARAATQLERAITLGLIQEDDDTRERRDWSLPFRLPVFDYADVPVDGAERAGPVEPYGWLWVEDAPVRALRDPDDPLRYSVVCDMRVSWEEMGRTTPPDELIVGSMPGRFVAP